MQIGNEVRAPHEIQRKMIPTGTEFDCLGTEAPAAWARGAPFGGLRPGALGKNEE